MHCGSGVAYMESGVVVSGRAEWESVVGLLSTAGVLLHGASFVVVFL
jgi:hypothetical protein